MKRLERLSFAVAQCVVKCFSSFSNSTKKKVFEKKKKKKTISELCYITVVSIVNKFTTTNIPNIVELLLYLHEYKIETQNCRSLFFS